MGPNVVVQLGLLNLMDAALGHASIGLNGAKVGLFTNDVDPGKGAVLGNFTLATFAGSTEKVITWGTAFLNSSGDAESLSGLETFSTDGVIPETVFGMVVVDGIAPTLLRFYARFDTAIGMLVNGNQLSLVVRLTISAAGFGASVQVAP